MYDSLGFVRLVQRSPPPPVTACLVLTTVLACIKAIRTKLKVIEASPVWFDERQSEAQALAPLTELAKSAYDALNSALLPCWPQWSEDLKKLGAGLASEFLSQLTTQMDSEVKTMLKTQLPRWLRQLVVALDQRLADGASLPPSTPPPPPPLAM